MFNLFKLLIVLNLYNELVSWNNTFKKKEDSVWWNACILPFANIFLSNLFYILSLNVSIILYM